MKLNVLIPYCTYDYKFIKKVIDSVLPFSDRVIITYSDRFCDGLPENLKLIEKTVYENPRAEFILVPHDLNKSVYGSQYWISLMRKVGIETVKSDVDSILFMDADEVVDTKQFIEFLSDSDEFDKYNAFSFLCYWYFREQEYRATTLENWCSVLIKKQHLNYQNILSKQYDRVSLFEQVAGPKINHYAYKYQPMLHHYSWALSKDGMLRKTQSWGHNKDRDWNTLIENEFKHSFNGTDCVHGYNYFNTIINETQ